MSRRTLFVALSLCLFTCVAFAQVGQFLEAPQFTAGTNPQGVAVGDFNNDGNPDFVVANEGSNNVSVLLGNGDGTFQAAKNYATGSTPQSIVVGDFNGDGKLDIAVTNSGSNTISVLLGNGNGTFAAAVNYATGVQPQGIAAGAFTSSGNLDLVVTNAHDGTMGVFINNGNGTFKSQVTYNTGFNPYSVAVGDLNGDGILDIAVANANNNDVISVFLGNGSGGVGNGTFGNQLQYPTGNTPVSIAVGDVNNDGKPDIVVADEGGNTVSVMLNSGSGSFPTHVEYNTAAFPTGVLLGQFLNNNGNLDIAVTAGNGNTVSILLNNGDGTFQTQTNFGAGDIPSGIAAADFNNSGTLDLVVADSGSNAASVLFGNGDGTFQTRIDYPAGQNPYAVATGDFNGDGKPDLAVVNSNCANGCSPSTVSILLGNGDGTFEAPTQFTTGTNTDPFAVATADLRGIGKLDLVTADYGSAQVSIMLGNGDGTFAAPVFYAVGSQPASVAIGDFNGDGKPDLAVTNFLSNNVSILLSNGDGTFKPAVNYTTGLGPTAVAIADFNGDKNLDLVVVNETSNNENENSVSILLGNGDGTFKAGVPYLIGTGGNPLSVATGDFNGDGFIDLAVADYLTQKVSVLLGNGDGTFQAVKFYATGANPSSVVSGDFNGDGKIDLALTSVPLNPSPGNLVSLLLGNGDGTFQSPKLFGTGSQAYSAVVGDFDQGGALDLAVANGMSNSVSVLLNTQGTLIGLTSSGSPSFYGQSVTFNATVAASVKSLVAPTGTVTFMNGSTVLGSGTLTDGAVSVTTSVLPTGTDTVSATYSGDSNFQAHTVSIIQTVQAPSGTTTALSSNSNSGAPTLTLTATVTSTAGTPAGTVNFMDGSSQLGSAPLNGSAIATYTTSALTDGMHSITAVYMGDTTFAGSTSNAQNISADFSLSASPLTPSSVAPGSSTTSTVTVTPMNGFNAAGVTFTCSVSPTVSPAASCSVGAITVANGAGSATLTVTTTGPTAALVPASGSRLSGMMLAFGLMIPALLLGARARGAEQARKMLACVAILLVLGGCLFQAACGGSNGNSGNKTGNSGTPAGSYSVSVTGTANGTSHPLGTALTFSVQ